ncbi:MAG: glycosyltransferase family 9 protein [Acidobacteria bacterium]|nr:glycosyltransferase family 9 protein [Acidobacteriota bacterium]
MSHRCRCSSCGVITVVTRTLVIQLGRLGDVIQTTPLLADLAAHGDELDVLVLHSVHDALLGCPAVANIITIPDAVKPLDDAIAFGFPLGEIPVEACELLADLQLPLYDRVINASHAPLGCWLAGEIPCTDPDARYGGIIRDGECLYLGPASVYRIAMLQFREQNLFNLVDLIRAIPGIAARSTQSRLYANQSSGLPFELPRGRRVAFNPGASEPSRCWPAENFSCLADALASAGFVPLLVGAPSDRDLCEKVTAASRLAIPNFAGRTTIPEMAALLARSDLLVSADTGAVHVAAAVGTTVVGLYGATAWFTETAPYGDNHLILQTPVNAPMSAISVDSVFAAALNRLDRLSMTDLRSVPVTQNQSAWETSINSPCSTDPLGGLTYRRVHRNPPTIDESVARSLRHAFATKFFAPSEAHDATQTEKSDAPNAFNSLAQILDLMHSVANVCADSVEKGIARASVHAAAAELIAATDKIRTFATAPAWRALSPVIHDLDWQLRMLPKQDPEATFRAHPQAYASAARILQNANAGQRRNPQQNAPSLHEVDDLERVSAKEGREGGQVPRSVRIQAPARQRGSVSP